MSTTRNRQIFEEACCLALKADGSRLTLARKAIIRALADAEGPLTAKEVMSRVSTRHQEQTGSVDLASVYRTLDRLADLNLVHPVSPQGSYLPCHHGQCKHSSHVLLACSGCAKLEEIHLPDQILGPLYWYLSESHHFKGDNRPFQITGLCKECKSA